MEEIFKDLKEYKEPKFGSMEWLNVQAGFNKISKMVEEDKNFKQALRNLLAMSIKDALANER